MPIYLPQYSPEFNPIELAFNKLKALIRGLHPQGVVAVREAFEWAWAQITPKNACAFFHECGLNPALKMPSTQAHAVVSSKHPYTYVPFCHFLALPIVQMKNIISMALKSSSLSARTMSAGL